MDSVEKGRSLPLGQAIQQATTALLCMDAERLEELARGCRHVVCDEQDEQVQAAGRDLRMLALTLEETRVNLAVLERLYRLRVREYRAGGDAARNPLAAEERSSVKLRRVVGYGDN